MRECKNFESRCRGKQRLFWITNMYKLAVLIYVVYVYCWQQNVNSGCSSQRRQKFGKSWSGEGSVSPFTPIMVCLHCQSAPAVLLVLLQGRYKKILVLSVEETQQDCKGDKIRFQKKIVAPVAQWR